MRKLLAFSAFLILTTSIAPSVSRAEKAPNKLPLGVAEAELLNQNRHPKTMSIAYWMDVAQCETGGNWHDKGRMAGGLGIFVGTWQNFGGRQFASTPDKATIIEQVVIANRISVHGFQTKNVYLTLADRLNNRPFFRPRSGFFGWGCIKNNRYLHPDVWLKNRKS